MKFLTYVKCILITIFMFGSFIGSSSKADNICDCISTLTYKTPKGLTQYVAKCYLQGEERGIFENTALKGGAEANARTKFFMEKHKIKENACVILPNGKMIAVPQK